MSDIQPADAFAISSSACFYPEMDDPEHFDGETFTWTFELHKSALPGAGLYRIEFIRILTKEEREGKSSALLSRLSDSGEG